MAGEGLERTSTVLALGGGVVGDVAGFAASTYMRGIHLVQVPTTLLAQVDSAIGGKTGIDLPSSKNMVGTFYQPRLVISDITALERLDRFRAREVRNGFAEVIKYGVIQDPVLFRMLEEKEDRVSSAQFLETIVWRAARVKAAIVEEDERETRGKRVILNYGHTFAHAFEAASNYRLPHGEAVALGMVCAARLAARRGIFPRGEEARQRRLIQRAGLPVRLGRFRLSTGRILRHMAQDKKVREGRPRFVLPLRVGRVRVFEDVSISEIKRVLSEIGGR